MTKRRQKTIEDPRIGIDHIYPKVSISGKPYERNQSTVRFDETYFVVLDRFISDVKRDELLAEIKAIIDGTITVAPFDMDFTASSTEESTEEGVTPDES